MGVESLYNCDMALHYLSYLVANGKPPEKLIDGSSDWRKLSMNLPALAGGSPVHYLCYEFKGRDLFRLEEIDPATGTTIG